jgi:uncharacterized ferredoxin-like protein
MLNHPGLPSYIITFFKRYSLVCYMTPEKTAVSTVAGLMALAARTAPKGKGIDTIIIKVLTGKKLDALADRLDELGKSQGIGFFLRDAGNIRASNACVVIGARGDTAAGIDCGACGFFTCAEMAKQCTANKKKTTFFAGPNCAIRMADLGIALGSAVKTAQMQNVDNRIMYSGGVAAIDLGLMGRKCTVAYAIPLSVTGKNIFFDRVAAK